VPQWNCGCPNCRAARADPARARTTCSVAISADGTRWVLLNAAPELSVQVASFRPLHPPAGGRASPLAAVVLTDAELDHVLGLLALRQAMTLHVTGTATIYNLLESSGLLRLLGGYLLLEWRDIRAGVSFPLDPAEGTGLTAVPLAVGEGKPPLYAGPGPVTSDATVGLLITDPQSGGSLVYMPVLPAISQGLLDVFRSASLVLLDGTLFAEDELEGLPNPRTARRLGHLPVGGPDGSLARLEPRTRSRVVYTHLNNTNPLLSDGSAACEELRRSGAAVAADGATYEL
jgi:pyrroloquinoline quinone biosynthesis protein B